MTRLGRKVEVELVDGGSDASDRRGAPPVEAAPSASSAGGPGRARRRLARAWPIAVVVVLVGAAYGVRGMVDAAAREALHETLAGQPGYVEDLSRPLRPVWTHETSLAYVGAVHGDVAIAETWGGDEVELTAIDVRTGTALWSLTPEPGTHRGCWSSLTDMPPTSPVVACLVTGEMDEGSSTNVLREHRLEHRDLATGALLARSSTRYALAASAWGDGLVELVAEDGVTLQRVDVEGQLRWSTRLSAAGDPAASLSHVAVRDDTALVVHGDHAWVVDASGQVVIEHRFAPRDEGSAEQASAGAWFFGDVELLPSGGYAFADHGLAETALYDADGQRVRSVAYGWPATPVDDGSLGSVVVLVNEEVRVLDPRTGEELFRDEGSVVGAIRDGAVIVGGRGKIRSVGITSREERWSVPAGDVLGTDGTTLLVHEGDGQGYLARGLDVRTGSEQWRVDVGPGSWLTVTDGHVFINGTSGITLLRP